MHRPDNLQRLATETFDLCIIGGGASGAGCALDAALRGLKVALVEKTDFAAGTSSRSTKLIHGGVRYLEQAFKKFDFAQLRQVRHGLEERHILLANAPHLARPLALLTPVFSWWEGFYYAIGLKLYDWFASGKDTMPNSRRLSRAEALRRLPALTPRLRGAVLYYDGQLDDARYCLALVQSAAEAGAVVVNHTEVLDFQKNEAGKIVAALARDQPGQTAPFVIWAHQFLNCAGPFADQLRLLANPALSPRIRPSKGVHVVLPHTVLPGTDALLIPKTPDGRVVFALPFEGQLLLGTTDHDYKDLEKEPVLEAGEVDFLLDTLQPYLAEKIDRKQVKAGFGGLRPLVGPPLASTPPPAPPPKGRGASPLISKPPSPSGEGPGEGLTRREGLAPKTSTKRLLRDHEVEHDASSGLLSLLGGKWTTYRLMARDAVDAVCQLLDFNAECGTAGHLLAGAEGYVFEDWQKLRAAYGFDEGVCQHLMLKYGARATQVAELTMENPNWGARLHPDFPHLQAEVINAVRVEMACGLRDVLARRLRLEVSDWAATAAVVPIVAALMSKELGWSATRREQEETAYVALLHNFQEKASGK